MAQVNGLFQLNAILFTKRVCACQVLERLMDMALMMEAMDTGGDEGEMEVGMEESGEGGEEKPVRHNAMASVIEAGDEDGESGLDVPMMPQLPVSARTNSNQSSMTSVSSSSSSSSTSSSAGGITNKAWRSSSVGSVSTRNCSLDLPSSEDLLPAPATQSHPGRKSKQSKRHTFHAATLNPQNGSRRIKKTPSARKRFHQQYVACHHPLCHAHSTNEAIDPLLVEGLSTSESELDDDAHFAATLHGVEGAAGTIFVRHCLSLQSKRTCYRLRLYPQDTNRISSNVEFWELTPAGKLPVLVTNDGNVDGESEDEDTNHKVIGALASALYLHQLNAEVGDDDASVTINVADLRVSDTVGDAGNSGDSAIRILDPDGQQAAVAQRGAVQKAQKVDLLPQGLGAYMDAVQMLQVLDSQEILFSSCYSLSAQSPNTTFAEMKEQPNEERGGGVLAGNWLGAVMLQGGASTSRSNRLRLACVQREAWEMWEARLVALERQKKKKQEKLRMKQQQQQQQQQEEEQEPKVSVDNGASAQDDEMRIWEGFRTTAVDFRLFWILAEAKQQQQQAMRRKSPWLDLWYDWMVKREDVQALLPALTVVGDPDESRLYSTTSFAFQRAGSTRNVVGDHTPSQMMSSSYGAAKSAASGTITKGRHVESGDDSMSPSTGVRKTMDTAMMDTADLRHQLAYRAQSVISATRRAKQQGRAASSVDISGAPSLSPGASRMGGMPEDQAKQTVLTEEDDYDTGSDDEGGSPVTAQIPEKYAVPMASESARRPSSDLSSGAKKCLQPKCIKKTTDVSGFCATHRNCDTASNAVGLGGSKAHFGSA
jgi:hypothetical protein